MNKFYITEKLYGELCNTLNDFEHSTDDPTDEDYLSDGEWLDVFVNLCRAIEQEMRNQFYVKAVIADQKDDEYEKLYLLGDGIDEVCHHLAMNGYDFRRCGNVLFVNSDQYYYVKTILTEHGVKFSEDIYRVLIEDERERQASPCCLNCANCYEEYGTWNCKVHDYPLECMNDKCDNWK